MTDNLPTAGLMCPICEGAMEVAYQRYGQTVLVCVDCHSSVTVTAFAADVLKRKREGTWTRRKP